MIESSRQDSLVIDSVASALANWSANLLEERHPELVERYGPSGRKNWVAHLDSQIRFLAQSVAVRRPEVFQEAMRWAQESYVSRDVNDDDLRQGLTCLRETVASELPPTLAPLATDYVQQTLDALEGPTAEWRSEPDDDVWRTTVLKYLEAILSSNKKEAEQLIIGLSKDGHDLPEIYERVLRPAQVQLGTLWHEGEISVALEHYGTAITESVMCFLRSRRPPKDHNGRLIIAASVAGETHELGLRMITDVFELSGWESMYLGANTPTLDLLELLREKKPHVLAVSTNSFLHLRSVGELISQVHQDDECSQTRIIIGGFPFNRVPDLWEAVGADGTASSATEAVELADRLVDR